MPIWGGGSCGGGEGSLNKGFFADESALIVAHPTGEAGWYASLASTGTVWFWDVGTSAWVDTGSVASGGDASEVTYSNPSYPSYNFVDLALTGLLTTTADLSKLVNTVVSVTGLNVGVTNVDSVSMSNNSSAYWYYEISQGVGNMRTGKLMACWLVAGGTPQWSEEDTREFGDTAAATLSVVKDGFGAVKLVLTIAAGALSNWTFKADRQLIGS